MHHPLCRQIEARCSGHNGSEDNKDSSQFIQAGQQMIDGPLLHSDVKIYSSSTHSVLQLSNVS